MLARCLVSRCHLCTAQRGVGVQVLDRALGESVMANAESAQLWVSRTAPGTGAPLAEVWRAAEVLSRLPDQLAWLAELLLVRR